MSGAEKGAGSRRDLVVTWRVWLGFRDWQGTGVSVGSGEQGGTGRDSAGTWEKGSAEKRPSMNWEITVRKWGTYLGLGIRSR